MPSGENDRDWTLPVAYADLFSSAPLVGARRRRHAAQAAAVAAGTGDPAAVRALAIALESADATVRAIARRSLTTLTSPAAIGILSTFLLDHDAPGVRTLVSEMGVCPDDPETRALFLIMLGRWEEYRLLDSSEGHPLLAASYARADPRRRMRIRETLQRCGNIHVLGKALLPLTKPGGADTMEAAEWREITGILTAGELCDDLWRLVTVVPPALAAGIVGFLENKGWKPKCGDQALWEDIRTTLQSEHVMEAPLAIRDFGGGAWGTACMTFSPGGDRFFGGGGDGTITSWDVRDGSILCAVHAHSGAVTFLAFAGDLLVSGGSDGIRVWDPLTMGMVRSVHATSRVTALWGLAESGTCIWGTEEGELFRLETVRAGGPLRMEGICGPLTCGIVLPGGERIAGGDTRGCVRIWHGSTGKIVEELRGHTGTVRSLAVSADGHTLTSGASDGTVRVWSIPDGRRKGTFHDHEDAVVALTFTHEGGALVSGSLDGTVRIQDLRRDNPPVVLRAHHGAITALLCIRDGHLGISGSVDATVKIWKMPEGNLIRTLKGHGAGIRAIAVSSDECLLATADGDGTVRFWTLPGGDPVRTLTVRDAPIRAIAITADRSLVADASDRTIRLWRAPEGMLVRMLEGHRDIVTALVSLRNRQILASGSRDRSIILWDTGNGRIIRRIPVPEHSVTALAAPVDGDVLASGGWDGEICIWRVSDGRRTAVWKGHERAVTGLVCSADGRTLISGSQDRSIRIWNSPAGTPVRTLEGHTGVITSLAMNPGEDQCASGSMDRSVKIWRLSDGELLHSFSFPEKVTSLVFTAPSVVTVGFDDGSAKILHVRDGRTIGTGEALRGAVAALTTDPDCRVLVAGSSCGTIRIWELPWDRPLACTTPDDLYRVEDILPAVPAGSTAQKKWQFIRSLLRARFRFEIEGGDPVESFEEYDIEIA